MTSPCCSGTSTSAPFLTQKQMVTPPPQAQTRSKRKKRTRRKTTTFWSRASRPTNRASILDGLTAAPRFTTTQTTCLRPCCRATADQWKRSAPAAAGLPQARRTTWSSCGTASLGMRRTGSNAISRESPLWRRGPAICFFPDRGTRRLSFGMSRPAPGCTPCVVTRARSMRSRPSARSRRLKSSKLCFRLRVTSPSACGTSMPG
mmetsp:Transcript_7500/g.21207  ORF Transcript_7500/g.21207 Transcript_7500/m.21207 type:complete len:204 (-) Transcript_7500:92-703(-)